MNNMLYQHIGCSYSNGFMFFVEENNNALLRVNANNSSICCLKLLSDGNSGPGSYRNVICHDNSIFLLPTAANQLREYDFTGRLKNRFDISEGRANVTGAAICFGKLYMFGAASKILTFDLNDNSINEINIDASGSYDGEMLYWTDSQIYNNNIYIPVVDNNLITVVDSDGKTGNIILGKKVREWKLNVISINNDKIYALFLNEENEYISGIYDMKGAVISENLIKFKRDIRIYPYTKAFLREDEWIILPYKYGKIAHVNVNGGEVEDYDDINNDKECLYNAFVNVEEKVYAIDQLSGNLLVYDKHDHSIDVRSLLYEKKDNKHLANIISDSNAILREMDDYLELPDFLNYVKSL